MAIQEVAIGNGPENVELLVEFLNEENESWDFSISDSTRNIGKNTKERFAFLWNKTKSITMCGKGLILELESKMNREPFLQTFSIKGKKVDILNVHVCSTNLAFCPESEINALSHYVLESPKSYNIILGDFNIDGSNIAFDKLKSNYSLSLANHKTTLKQDSCKADSYLANAYDNFIYSNEINCISSGVIDLVKSCENFESNDFPSDHLPIYMTFRVE